MNTVFIGLGLGLVAALLDIIPMLIQKLPLTASLSAFTQWLFLGVIITTCDLGLPGWVTGMILGFAGSVPIQLALIGNPVLMPPGQGVKTIVPILASSLILGTAVGFASRLFRP